MGAAAVSGGVWLRSGYGEQPVQPYASPMEATISDERVREDHENGSPECWQREVEAGEVRKATRGPRSPGSWVNATCP